MLALSRKPGEEIFIGPDITVRVVRFDGLFGGEPRVILGIEAPDDVRILRDDAGHRREGPPRRPIR